VRNYICKQTGAKNLETCLQNKIKSSPGIYCTFFVVYDRDAFKIKICGLKERKK
jgi:hypothetical protein